MPRGSTPYSCFPSLSRPWPLVSPPTLASRWLLIPQRQTRRPGWPHWASLALPLTVDGPTASTEMMHQDHLKMLSDSDSKAARALVSISSRASPCFFLLRSACRNHCKCRASVWGARVLAILFQASICRRSSCSSWPGPSECQRRATRRETGRGGGGGEVEAVGLSETTGGKKAGCLCIGRVFLLRLGQHLLQKADFPRGSLLLLVELRLVLRLPRRLAVKIH
jgi:hypothetical protein